MYRSIRISPSQSGCAGSCRDVCLNIASPEKGDLLLLPDFEVACLFGLGPRRAEERFRYPELDDFRPPVAEASEGWVDLQDSELSLIVPVKALGQDVFAKVDFVGLRLFAEVRWASPEKGPPIEGP